MSNIEDIRKALQDFIAPEIQNLTARLEIIGLTLKNLEEKMDYRFDAIMRELALDKRLTNLERDRDEKKESQQ